MRSRGLMGVFGFDSALLILKAGGRVRRLGWGSNGNWLQLKQAKPNNHQVASSLMRSTSDGFEVPYTPSALDIMCCDWTAEHIEDMVMTQDQDN
jgi:hypothetical protein